MKSFLLASALMMVVCHPALATPIRYTVEFTPGPFSSFDPMSNGDPLGLEGSQFSLEYEWDAASLTPDFDAPDGGAGRVTVWPSTNLILSLTITGSSGADGTHAGTTSGGSKFQLTDNDTTPQVVDSVQFPSASFGLPGQTIDIAGLIAQFPISFNTPASPGTVFPYPFQASDVTSWQSPSIIDFANDSDSQGQSVVGSAAVVPEPSTFLLFAISFVCFGVCARRHGN